LYAIPANQSLQHHHAHQLHQHVIQTSTGPMIVHSAQLASLQRQQGIAAGLISQPPGQAQGKIVGVVQAAPLTTPSTNSTPPPTACEGTLGQRTLSGVTAKSTGRVGELVCTCPPELHQVTDCAPCQAEREATLLSNGAKLDQTQPFAWGNKTVNEGCTDTCLPCRNQNSDAESQVNYLVALFQALKASGVHDDSFSSALCRLGITTGEKDDQRRLLTQLKKEIEDIRSSLSDVKQKCYGVRNFIVQETQAFERQLVVHLRRYDKKKGLCLVQPFFDSRMQRVRADRQALDNALAAYQTTWSSLIGQLADLEGVIEETGNDVLRGRCRITLPVVSALEERLHLAISAIEFCCENDPLLRKSVWQQAENEWNSAEHETRTLEKQLDQLSDLKERSSKLNGTISTLKRLAKVNANTRNSEQHLQRLHSLGGVLNPGAANSGSVERKRLLSTIKLLQPDHEERMRSMEIQDALRERRKRVFRDPPVIRAPAKALLLNGIHISPIWSDAPRTKRPGHPGNSEHKTDISTQASGVHTTSAGPRQRTKQAKAEDSIRHTPDDSFDSGDAGEPNTTANLPPPLRTPCILPANCVDHLPQESSTVNSQAPTTKVTPGLLKRSGMKSKGGLNVTFNTRVKVDDGSQEVQLNCILDDDQPESVQEVIPRGGRLIDTRQQDFRKCGEAGGESSSPTKTATSAAEASWETSEESRTVDVTIEGIIATSSPQKSQDTRLFSRLAPELPPHSELPPPPPSRLSSKLVPSVGHKPDNVSVNVNTLLKYENMDSLLATLDSQNIQMSSVHPSHPDNERRSTE
uniref:AIP3 domain-containing protein n=1 Tax=Schistocephalus solidus TaxID=70667 RepID=A0A183SDK9_SCHSO